MTQSGTPGTGSALVNTAGYHTLVLNYRTQPIIVSCWQRRSRSSGEPFSIRKTEASVLVAKNWKMDNIHLAEICITSQRPISIPRTSQMKLLLCSGAKHNACSQAVKSMLAASAYIVAARHKESEEQAHFVAHDGLNLNKFKKPKAYAMGSHMRRMEPSEPPWLLNQSVKLTLSKARTLRMPPSGSTRALTMGDVPKAKEFAACTNQI
ncbi:MAG: hypothetical protein FRX49_07991 [Trebouxia sp. A1-2]|nr:MAG: hypothetical protein FRX49_07991 [Trebouxia sp. A1-2]